jgi:hypothetical protein
MEPPDMKKTGLACLLLAAALAACKPASPPSRPPSPKAAAAPEAEPADYPPVDPIAPGQPGGLPDDRTPISEAPFAPTSPQGAADVVQTYFALLGEKAYDRAWTLWAGDGTASDMSQAQFAASFGPYLQYSAQVGAPGRPEGAAGSSYISVPVQVYGRMKTGEPFHRRGEAVLRRVNDVPGSTPTQRLWRIARLDVKPVP